MVRQCSILPRKRNVNLWPFVKRVKIKTIYLYYSRITPQVGTSKLHFLGWDFTGQKTTMSCSKLFYIYHYLYPLPFFSLCVQPPPKSPLMQEAHGVHRCVVAVLSSYSKIRRQRQLPSMPLVGDLIGDQEAALSFIFN